MRVCGIELKSDELIAVVVDSEEVVASLKLALKDDESQDEVKSFCAQWQAFLQEVEPRKLIIKKRSKKGRFAGGPVSFKIEALVQLSSDVEVGLVTGAKVSAVQKKANVALPANLKKYQEAAFWSAFC